MQTLTSAALCCQQQDKWQLFFFFFFFIAPFLFVCLTGLFGVAAMEGVDDEGVYGGDDEQQGHQQQHEEGGDEDIRQDDSWTVISSYFEEKGLVRQQLDSFNEFLEHSLQEIIEGECF